MMKIAEMLNLLPDYVGKGIVQLLVVTLCGIIVAWITTYVFGRRSEINAVEGSLLKRKLDIYEELSGRIEALKSLVIIPEDIHQAALKALKEQGIRITLLPTNQLFGMFDSPNSLKEKFLDIDKYISTKRIYFDNDVLIQTLRFQNYFATIRRLQVMFEEQFVNQHIPLDKKEVAAAERLLTVEIGMTLQKELTDQMNKVISVMKQSFKNLTFNHRDEIKYDYEFFNSEDGPIMRELIHTSLFSKNKEIQNMVDHAIAIGMAGCIVADKKKG